MPPQQPAILPASTDYTDRDLASLRGRFQALIRSVLPAWTDHSPANLGSLLTDFFAFQTDLMGFNVDAQAAEAYLATATQRASLLKLAAILGYVPQGITAAQTVLTFTATGLTGTIVIKAGTLVSTLSEQSAVTFQTLSDLTLTVAQPVGSVAAENSVNRADSLVSTGEANLSMPLGLTLDPPESFLAGSAVVSTTTQGAFTEQAGNSFINAGPSDQVFVVKTDANDQARIVFGDGVSGAIATGTINVSYRTGGGKIGNVGAGTIQRIVSFATPAPSLGAATLTVTNALAATGGKDHEAIEPIRSGIPASISKPSMSVHTSDFETHACEVPGVLRAVCLGGNQDGLIPMNTLYLFLVMSGDPALFMATMDQVRRQFSDDENRAPFPLLATQILRLFVASYVDVDVVVRISLKTYSIAANVKAEIVAALQALFSPTNADGSPNTSMDFGYGYRSQSRAQYPKGILPESSIEDAIRDCDGVREVDPSPAGLTLTATRKIFDPGTSTFVATVYDPSLPGTVPTWVRPNGTRDDVQIDYNDSLGPPAVGNFPRLGSITIINEATGAPL